jgi:hypothetical protein
VGIAIIGGVLLASASAFSGALKGTDRAARMSQATIFLDATMQNVAAQNYDNLLSLDGNDIFDGNDAGDSEYGIRLGVFLSQVDLVQINATLTDLDSGRVAGRVTTLRSRR